MTWTPETLARAFHESYTHVSPRFFGTQGHAPDWDSIPERSREHLIAVCADVLGVKKPLERVKDDLEPVPEKVEFQKAAAAAFPEEAEEADDGLSNWENELRKQIDEASKKARDLLKKGTK